MNSDDAVRSFALAGNLQIGGSLNASAGPIGTGGAIQAAIAHPAPMFSYSRSKGLFAGLSLEGTVLVERKDANREFYGQPIPAADLLSGKVPAPEAASAMYEVVEAAEAVDETGVPQQSYVPGVNPGDNRPVGLQEAYDIGSGLAAGSRHASSDQAAATGAKGGASSTALQGASSNTVFDAGQQHS